MKRLTLAIIGLFFFQYAAHAAVPTIERQALVALYNSTNGAEWKNDANWLKGDPCTDLWHGIACNELTGSIPPELGNLINLERLNLLDNQLTGSIPPELGDLISLQYLDLEDNQLSGSIPPEFGDLTNLISLNMQDNQLGGSIPAELGKLANLKSLRLKGNVLTGELPAELANITSVHEGSLNLDWNALFTSDAALDALLDTKSRHDWSTTQTVAPDNVAIINISEHKAVLTWDAIEYLSENGHYRVLYSTTPGGPYLKSAASIDKTATGLTVNGLPADSTLYFVVQTETDPHATNLNKVVSDASFELSIVTPVAPHRFYITSTSDLITSEAGSIGTFEVSLDTQPSADVTITIISSDTSEGSVSHDTLTFTSGNWNVPQVVTVTGEDDDEADGHQQYTVITGVASSTDIAYDGIDPRDLPVTNEDDGDITTQALKAIYNSTGGPGWKSNTNWLVGDPCKNNWFGVICDVNANIIELDLGWNGLNGTVPQEIGNVGSC